MFDTIIIGNGPAGISAAIYLKRFNYNPLVIAKDNGALGKSSYIDNYYGIPHIKGTDLVDAGIAQAKSLGIEVLEEEVISIDYGAKGYTVNTKENHYDGLTVFLATGKARNSLILKGLNEYEGKGVSYCAICDGFFFRNKKLAVIGEGDFMQNELETLLKFTKDITVFTNGQTTNSDYENIVTDKLVEIIGDNEHVTAIKTDKNEYDVDGIFIAYGSANAVSFAKHMGLVTDSQNNLIVKDFQTNIKGIFAGGDVIGGLLQVSKAVSDGANAAIEIKKYLTSLSKATK
ncbi:MAG: FAD-dependent oxidoreductase [Acholeplasmatales bacterium]|nr:FAD-dependent oxidoreductase [Acholeplasmatales bacterium]